MVLTRRQAQEDRLAKEREGPQLEVQSQTDVQTPSQHLSRADTQIEIVLSATGQGTHTRWIRHHPLSVEETDSSNPQPDEVVVDARYITPAPASFSIPGAPQKARGIPRTHTTAISPPVWNVIATIEEEPHVDGDPANILGSPFPGCQATGHLAADSRPLRLEPTILVEDEPSLDGRTDTEIIYAPHRAFGPNGTHLYNSRGEEIFVEL